MRFLMIFLLFCLNACSSIQNYVLQPATVPTLPPSTASHEIIALRQLNVPKNLENTEIFITDGQKLTILPKAQWHIPFHDMLRDFYLHTLNTPQKPLLDYRALPRSHGETLLDIHISECLPQPQELSCLISWQISPMRKTPPQRMQQRYSETLHSPDAAGVVAAYERIFQRSAADIAASL